MEMLLYVLMRFFIALEIPEESKQEISKVQHQVQELFPQARLTYTDKLHLTIAFIGEQPEEVKEQLVELLADATQGIPPFTVTPAYLDGFPNLHHAHTMWIGLKGEIDKLMVVRERIKDGLIDLSLPVDARRYTPHIAIAKLPPSFELAEQLEEQFQQMMMSLQFEDITISSIKLYESVADEGFHTHNTLAEVKLTD